MAEIEYFVNPKKKSIFPKFSSVSSLTLTLFSACDQMEGVPPRQVTLADAVESVSMLANEWCTPFHGLRARANETPLPRALLT